MILERIEARSLQARVYHRLKQAMMSGAFEPGQVLIIRELAEQLGVSPMPVRQSLHRLVSEHALVEEDKARASVLVPQLSDVTFEELRAARVLVEGEAAALAAARADKTTMVRLRKLDSALIKAISAKDVAGAIDSNYEFHFALYAGARSTILLRIIESLWLQSGPYFRVLIKAAFEKLGEPFAALRSNELVLKALEEGDGAAARAALADDINSAAAFYRSIPGRNVAGAPRRRGAKPLQP